MRLRDYQDLINRAIPIIEKFTISQQSISGYPGTYQVSNVQNFLRIIEELNQAHLFIDEISKIIQTPNLNNSIENTITINNQSKTSLSTLRTNLLSSAKLLQKTLKEVLSEEDENVLNIKLPEKYSSISDYIRFFEEIKDICSPFKYVNEEVTITNFDVGTEWIGLKLAESGIKLFISIADKSATLFNKILESKKIIAEIDKLKTENTGQKLKALETTIDIINKNSDQELEEFKTILIEEAIKESKFVLDKNLNDNEFKNLLRIAIYKMGNLLLQGMEIVPAINAKPEVKQLSQKASKNIEEKRKLIIGCDNLKYITVQDSNIDTRNIPGDTLEINNNEK